ncbi:MAG: pantoate--beta-alanine ligase, partial [Planctomycetales bacterium]|nr:pantoate--beta-alanine ligase [Planctomycetales bacterium]
MSDHSHIIHQIQEARSRIKEAQRQGLRVGVVPTMGALHEGHLSLIDTSEEECDRTVVWIFVNPTQFAPTEDLEKYPRTLQADTAAVGSRGAWFVFAPEVSTIYPAGFSTFVEPPSVAGRWEGEFRPTHFRGVSTVVLKLLQILPADRAYFGEKDFQQLQVIRAMA